MTIAADLPLRVRGILLTADGELLVIRRIRPGQAPYCVFPGGGVEPDDHDEVAALLRECTEELGADIAPLRRVQVIRRTLSDGTRQEERFWLARAYNWDEPLPSSPELSDPARGQYLPTLLPITPAAFAEAHLKPAVVADLVLIARDRLESLPAVELEPASS